MIGVFAEFERSMIQERVRAGLARAKAAGTKLGRRRIDSATEKNIRQALRKGDIGMRKIAVELGVGTAPCSASRTKCDREVGFLRPQFFKPVIRCYDTAQDFFGQLISRL
jgi:hypothetical protein